MTHPRRSTRWWAASSARASPGGSRLRGVVVLFLSVVLSCSSAAPQTVPFQTGDTLLIRERVVPPEPTCTSCKIGFIPVLTIRPDLGGAEHVGWGSSVARGLEYLFVANHLHGEGIGVFSLQGRYIKTLGREGEGPGEFREVLDLEVGPGDTLLAFDDLNQRITVFSPTHQVARTLRIQGKFMQRGATVLWDGSFLLNQIIPTQELIGFPVHWMTSDGEVIRSFGDDPSLVRTAEMVGGVAGFLWITPSSEERFWTAGATEFAVKRRHLRGSGLEVLRLEGWESAFMNGVPDGLGRPLATISDIWEDPLGRLWVLFRVPDPDWESSVRRIPAGLGHRPWYEVEDWQGYWDTVVAVIDPEDGTPLVVDRYPGWISSFLPDGEVVSYIEEVTGDVSIQLRNMTIKGLIGGKR